ncbi:MAG: VanW family protein [Caulobacteraceae bacterium]
MKNFLKMLIKPLIIIMLLSTFAGCRPAEIIPESKTQLQNYQNISNAGYNVPPPVQPLPTATPAPTKAPAKAPAKTTAKKAPNNNIIGGYSTSILDDSDNRVNNILLAVDEIDGTKLSPGEVFSFNGTVGSRTASDGYKKARIILKGKKDYGRGGGVCQVSSTLYSAAKDAGLQIVERHPHSKHVPYISKGMDATVIYGQKDLRFRNNKPYSIVIDARVINNKVRINIIRSGD